MVQGLPYCAVGQQHLVLQGLARARGRAVEGGVSLGFGVWGLGFGVWGLGFGVWGLGYGVWGLGLGFGITCGF